MSEDALPARPDHLSVEQVTELEHSLQERPDDLEGRKRLLIHYKMAAFHSTEAREAHQRHVLWIIRHHPESDLAGTPYVLLQQSPPEILEEAKALWAQQITRFPENARIWGHGGEFLLSWPYKSTREAQEWLQTAARLDPTDPKWPKALGRLAESGRRQSVGNKSAAAARRALDYYAQAYTLTTEPKSRVYLLDHLAKNAFASDDLPRAQEYATQLLNSALQNPNAGGDWNYGNALHWSHIVLGSIALLQGAKGEASAHLREAGKTPGSPQLDSFGPDLSLVRELLKQGEREEAILYFKACSRFWKSGQDRLTTWLSASQQGNMPDLSEACSL